MALLSLHTEKGSATVNASNELGLVIATADGSELQTSILKGQSTLNTGLVKISPTIGTYTIKPEGDISITFDASDIGSNNAQFSLILDMNDAVRSVTFPEDFKWNGDAPDMSAKGTYAIDVLRISVGEVEGYIGNYSGVVKAVTGPTGFSITVNGEEIASGEYLASFNTGSYLHTDIINIVVHDGSEIGTLTISPEEDLWEYEAWEMDVTLSMSGGYIGRLNLDNLGSVTMTGGSIGYIYACSDGNFDDMGEIFTFSGGTIGSIYLQYFCTYPIITGDCHVGSVTIAEEACLRVTGGVVDSITSSGYPYFFNMYGGTIGKLTYGDDTGEYVIEGGYIAELIGPRPAGDILSGVATVDLSNCHVGYVESYSADGYGHIGWDMLPTIGDNVKIDRWSFVSPDDYTPSSTIIDIGEGSEIGISLSTQDLVADGRITFTGNVDGIINLED